MSYLSPESFARPPLLPAVDSQPPGGRFGPLVDHFAEFRSLVVCLAENLRGPEADAAWKIAAGLELWAAFLEDAREAARRAPETDLVLTRTWGARLSDIVRDARHALCLDDLISRAEPGAAAPAAPSAGSIARHETVLPLSRIAKSAPQPVAGAIGRRPPRLRRRRH